MTQKVKKQKTLLKPLACSDLSLVLQAASGRQRRRAVFGTADLTPPAAPSDEEEEEEEEEVEDKDVGKDMEARQQSGSSAESSGRDDSDAESDESEGESLPLEPCFEN